MDGSRRSSHGNAYFTGFGRAQAHRVLRHAARAPRARRDRGRARARARSLQAEARAEADGLVGGAVARRSWRCSRGSPRRRGSTTGLGVPDRCSRSACAPGVALILFFLALPVFTFVLGAALVALLAPARVRGRRLRRRAMRRRAALVAGAGQALRGQRVDADAGSAAIRRSTIRIRPRRCASRASRRWPATRPPRATA